uniref:Putative secreted protein n=1 Tax=Anopheles darlingi TaxID=43151 RepID=A0A2M4DKD4_ANODA
MVLLVRMVVVTVLTVRGRVLRMHHTDDPRYLDAGCDVRTALLVSAGTPVARQPGNAILARALARRVVARLAGRTDRMAIA